MSPPPLPVTWRPVLARRVVAAAGLLLLGSGVALALLLPGDGDGEGGSGTGDRLAFVGFGVVGTALLALFARPRVTADDTGVTIVNLLGSRRLAWAEIVAVDLRPGAPWVVLDLDDGGTLPALGIQSSDGERAHRAAAELRALVAARSRTPRDD